MKALFSAVLLIALTGPAIAGPNGDCTCRHKGGDVPEGQTACISTPKGMMLALCDRVLNNTSWKMLNQPCPNASLNPPDLDSESEIDSSESIAPVRPTERS
ncbi:MAG: hypothetical protein ACR2O0_10445 [Rhizobiaceae bacterium]